MLNIVLIGLVSFFVDVSTEMVYPLIPLYLTSALGATPAIVGVIEGIAESLASLLKVWSGYISDKYRKRKPLVFLGYSTAIIYKLALVVSTSWFGILIARVIDRFGKGLRTAPRDVLVSESADKDKLGGAFGLHKALDMAGTAIGVLAAYFLLVQAGSGQPDYKNVFMWSVIPAVIGLVVLLFVKEKSVPREKAAQPPHLIAGFKSLPFKLKLFLLTAFVFTLGNSSNAFLLLRAEESGWGSAGAVLLYFVYSAVSSLLSIPFGMRSDKTGRRRMLVIGYAMFAVTYFGFALSTGKAWIAAMFVVYGFYTALTAGVERALVAEIAPPEIKGTVLGLHSSIVGIALLPASVIAGALYNSVSPAAPFWLGGSLALVASIALFFILKDNKN